VVGQKVECRYMGMGLYYPGTVMRTDGKGKYDVLYDDDGVENHVDGSLLRACSGSGSEPNGRTSEKGDDQDDDAYAARLLGSAMFAEDDEDDNYQNVLSQSFAPPPPCHAPVLSCHNSKGRTGRSPSPSPMLSPCIIHT
jgi:hypothetical protein